MSKWVFVSGCSSGIGRAAVMDLKVRGYHVIASVRNESDRDELISQGIEHCIIMDLASEESVAKAAESIIQMSQGKLFAIFNNGAYGQPGAVEDLSRDALRKQFEANVFGTQDLTNRLLPTLIAQPEARIIQCSSILGFISMPMRGAYNASKHALEALSDTMRMELSETRVKVSIIQPGPILTRFRANALKALEDNLDFSKSRHQQRYRQALQRLTKEGAASRYTLPPDAVVDKLIHALESPRPKARYRVTFPTYLMAFLKPLLPTAWLDRILLNSAESRSGS